ncbi:MAG: hypothetical protein AAFO07_15870, partial [Bacteroidota bacterium]
MDESKYENIERYLDNLMDEAERSAFEASLEKDNELADALAQQKEVNAVLGDIFEADLKAELMAKGKALLESGRHEPKEETTTSPLTVEHKTPTRSIITWAGAAAAVLIGVSIIGIQMNWFGNQPNLPDANVIIADHYDLDGVAITGLLNIDSQEDQFDAAIGAFELGDYQDALIGFNNLLAVDTIPQRNKLLLLSGISY